MVRATRSRSIAYTYNDPVIFLEYAVDVAKVARQRGIKNVAVTAGYIASRARQELFSAMDAANVDLKAFSEEFDNLQVLVHRSIGRGPRDARIFAARDEGVARDYNAVDSGF